MSKLSDFLLARIATDEALAWAAFDDVQHEGKSSPNWLEASSGIVETGDGELVITGDSGVSRHMVNWDPARVLAQCAANRRIVDGYEHAIAALDRIAPASDEMVYMGVRVTAELMTFCAKLLALPYADHADYQQPWSQVTTPEVPGTT